MGRVVDAVTDKEMALLIGCSMYDEATKHDVLVLAVQEDEDTGYSEGLGCTVVDLPYTLHPTPYTLNPKPQTLNPQSSTLNPKPSTLNHNPKP